MAVYYGQIAIVPKGTWNASTEYKVGNLVEYNGSSYVVKVKPPVGTLPTDKAYWQVSAQGGNKATASALGVVKPDGTTTTVNADGVISAKPATQNTAGIVKGGSGVKVESGGALKVDTAFTQATALANIIANEAMSVILGKVSKAIATTMSLDQNALLKNMLSSVDVNNANKIPTSAYIHTLVERIGMGTDLTAGDNLTAAVENLNRDLGGVKTDLVKCWSEFKGISVTANTRLDLHFDATPLAGKTILSQHTNIIATSSTLPEVVYFYSWEDPGLVTVLSNQTDFITIQYSILYKDK